MSPRLQVGFKEMNGSVLERDAQSVFSADSDNEMEKEDQHFLKSFFIILISLKGA